MRKQSVHQSKIENIAAHIYYGAAYQPGDEVIWYVGSAYRDCDTIQCRDEVTAADITEAAVMVAMWESQ